MTSIGAVKDALVEILAAACPSAQVIPGPADVTTLGNRAVVVGGETTPVDVQVTDLAGTSGTATYTLTITASVSLPGTDESKAEDMAAADFAASVAAIEADSSLGLADVSATVSGAGELFETSGAAGRSAAVRFPVMVYTILGQDAPDTPANTVGSAIVGYAVVA